MPGLDRKTIDQTAIFQGKLAKSVKKNTAYRLGWTLLGTTAIAGVVVTSVFIDANTNTNYSLNLADATADETSLTPVQKNLFKSLEKISQNLAPRWTDQSSPTH